MKTREFELRKSIPGCIMTLFLVILALIYTGCSKDNEVTTYTVIFDADGGSPVPPTQSVEAGNTVTAPATNPAKSG
ncbi:MAG: InlB B-repeat-containing protein [Tannerellaceae bacterium]|nr:InlB B-repeat-containing protein [Tannerellaceae bacterium]